jgi:hypothetical protein
MRSSGTAMGIGIAPHFPMQSSLHGWNPLDIPSDIKAIGNGLNDLKNAAGKLATDAWGAVKGAANDVAKFTSDNWTKIAETFGTGGANVAVQIVTGKDYVDIGVKAGWDMTKKIVRWGENIANVPAGWINAGIKKITPDSWSAYIDLLFPKTPVQIPTNWSEFKQQFQQVGPIAANILSMCGPWGMAAAAAISIVLAVMRGASWEEIGWAAVEGATPYYIRMAMAAVRAVAKGGSPTQMLGNAVMDAAGQYFNNPVVNAAIAAAKEILASKDITADLIATARQAVKDYLSSQGISSGQLYDMALSAFEIIASSVSAVVHGQNVKSAALNTALDMGDKFFDKGSAEATGFAFAKGILKGDNVTDVMISQARAKVPLDQLDGFDKAVAVANNIRGGGTVNVAVDAAVNSFDSGSDAYNGAVAAKNLISQGLLGDKDKSTDIIANAKSNMNDQMRVGFDVVIGAIARGTLNTPVGSPSAATVSGQAAPPPSVIVFAFTQDELAQLHSQAIGQCPGGVAGGWCVAEAYAKAFNAAAAKKKIDPPPALNTAQILKQSQIEAVAPAKKDCEKVTGVGYGNCMNARTAYHQKVIAAQYVAQDICKNVTGIGHGSCMDASIAQNLLQSAALDYANANCNNVTGQGHGLCMDAMMNRALTAPGCKWDSGFNDCVTASAAPKPFPWLLLAAAGIGGYLLLRQK